MTSHLCPCYVQGTDVAHLVFIPLNFANSWSPRAWTQNNLFRINFVTLDPYHVHICSVYTHARHAHADVDEHKSMEQWHVHGQKSPPASCKATNRRNPEKDAQQRQQIQQTTTTKTPCFPWALARNKVAIPVDIIDPVSFPTLPTKTSTLDIDNGKQTTSTTATTTTDNNERAPKTTNNDEDNNNNNVCNNDDDEHNEHTPTKKQIHNPKQEHENKVTCKTPLRLITHGELTGKAHVQHNYDDNKQNNDNNDNNEVKYVVISPMVPVTSGPERKCIPIDLIDPLNFPTLPTMMSTIDIDNGKQTTLTTVTTTTDNNERAPTTMNNDEDNNDACNNDDGQRQAN